MRRHFASLIFIYIYINKLRDKNDFVYFLSKMAKKWLNWPVLWQIRVGFESVFRALVSNLMCGAEFCILNNYLYIYQWVVSLVRFYVMCLSIGLPFVIGPILVDNRLQIEHRRSG